MLYIKLLPEIISIHSLRMEGDFNESVRGVKVPDISIHSLRMEGDIRRVHKNKENYISIHSLRMEGDRL